MSELKTIIKILNYIKKRKTKTISFEQAKKKFGLNEDEFTKIVNKLKDEYEFVIPILFKFDLRAVRYDKLRNFKDSNNLKIINNKYLPKKIKTKTVKFSDIMKHPNLSLSPKDYIK
jgi:ATP sulfurylase|tara:strand:+ start:40 stop:387 length:348 start_codon:yes stop_codon:yes gene_type:complete